MHKLKYSFEIEQLRNKFRDKYWRREAHMDEKHTLRKNKQREKQKYLKISFFKSNMINKRSASLKKHSF